MGSTTIRYQSNQRFIDKVKLINKISQTNEHELFKLLKDGWPAVKWSTSLKKTCTHSLEISYAEIQRNAN